MRKIGIASVLAISCVVPPGWAACPSRSFTYTAGNTISPSEVTTNEDNLYNKFCSGVDTYVNASIPTAALQDAAVTAAKLGTGSVTTTIILDDTIAAADIAAGAVGTSEIATSGVDTDEITNNAVTATDLSATLTFSDGDVLDLDAINVSSTTEGILLPQTTSCTSGTAEGQVCWDTDDDTLNVGTGSASTQIRGAQVAVGSFTRDTSVASGTQAITGVGFQPRVVIFFMAQSTGTGESSWGFDNDTTSVSIRTADGITADTMDIDGTNAINDTPSSGNEYVGNITTLGSDGFTITWTRTGTPTGTITIYYLAIR